MNNMQSCLVCWVSVASATWYIPCNDYNSDVQSALTTAETSSDYDKVDIVDRNCIAKSEFSDDEGAKGLCDIYNNAIATATNTYNLARIIPLCEKIVMLSVTGR